MTFLILESASYYAFVIMLSIVKQITRNIDSHEKVSITID